MDIRDLKAAGEHAQNFGCFTPFRKYLKISGIYAIINIFDGKIYIGSAVHIGNRFHKHRILLRANKHPNKHLQLAWNKYWEINFEFKILEYVENKSLLLHCEDSWIEQTKCHDNRYGYNTRKIATSNLGLKWTAETNAKRAASNIGKSRNKGFKHSEATKLKVSLANKGKSKPHFRNNTKYPHGYYCQCSIGCIEIKRKARRDSYHKNKHSKKPAFIFTTPIEY